MMDNEDNVANRKNFKKGFIVAAVSGGLFALLMIIWVFITGGLSWGTNKMTEINLHVLLMPLFMVLLQGFGALMFRTLLETPKPKVKLIHAGMQVLALLGVAIGAVSSFRAHSMLESPHLFSLHSWIGLLATLGFYAQSFGGIASFFSLSAIPYHKISGPLIFSIGCLACLTGITEKALWTLKGNYPKRTGASFDINFAGISLVVFFLAVLILLVDPRFRRISPPEAQAIHPGPAAG